MTSLDRRLLAAVLAWLVLVPAAQAAAAAPDPPPIRTFPAAGPAAPPASAIAAHPLRPESVCGTWRRATLYAGQPTGATWWEYTCTLVSSCGVGSCDANWSPSYETDHFYWDGSSAEHYGTWFTEGEPGIYPYCDWWTDVAAANSYGPYVWRFPDSCWSVQPEPGSPLPVITRSCEGLTCRFDAGESSDPDGSIVGYVWDLEEGDWESGETVERTFGTPGPHTVRLMVVDDSGLTAWAQGYVWAGNDAPVARFAYSCIALDCVFDARASSDDIGGIEWFDWDFGDGATSRDGSIVHHRYTQTASYDVKLTVTDHHGAVGSRTEKISLLRLTARGYRAGGFPTAELTWNAVPGTYYWVYRGSQRVGIVSGGRIIDRPPAEGTTTYKVCRSDNDPNCTNAERVTF